MDTKQGAAVDRLFVPVLVVNNPLPTTDAVSSNASDGEKYKAAMRKQGNGVKLRIVKNDRTLPNELPAIGPKGTKRIAASEQRIPIALISNLLVDHCCLGNIVQIGPRRARIRASITILHRGRPRTILGEFAPLLEDADLILPRCTLKRFNVA